ncbi:hypothetical protein [Embleya sp. AB8]|uniref:hypothetical protein n=1 Tax=Embleya sp. AB8 TaxID=3156304 RepID=UPI003C706C58
MDRGKERNAEVSVEYEAAWLRELPPDVRSDVIDVLTALVADVPRRIRHTEYPRIPLMRVSVCTAGDRPRVEVLRPVDLQGGYWDEFSRWIVGSAAKLLSDRRCGILSYGTSVHDLGPKWAAYALGGPARRDRAVIVHVRHECGVGKVISLPVLFRNPVWARMRFHPAVHTLLANAREPGEG